MSDRYELVKGYYDRRLWNADRVRDAAVKGWSTQDDCTSILGAE